MALQFILNSYKETHFLIKNVNFLVIKKRTDVTETFNIRGLMPNTIFMVRFCITYILLELYHFYALFIFFLILMANFIQKIATYETSYIQFFSNFD